MKYRILIYLALLLNSVLGAQNGATIETGLPEVIPPSPTVANLMRFEEVPVSEYTGLPEISIPLYQKALAPNLNLSMSLQYNPSGIRVEERSSWVGTGWSLNTGGVISRTIMDAPDEKLSQGNGLGVLNNNFYNFDNFNVGQVDEFLYKAYRDVDHYDSEPDLFQFNFLGYSGRFVIVKEANQFVCKQLGQDANIKIEVEFNYVNNSPNEIVKFILIDPSGYIYQFDVRESTTSQSVTTSRSQKGDLTISPTLHGPFAQTNYSSWHLSSVKAPNNIVLCEFDYSDITESYVMPHSETMNRVQEFGTQAAQNEYQRLLGGGNSFADYNDGVLKPFTVFSTTHMSVETKKLSEITFRDNTKIEFALENGHPEYSGSGAKLKSIVISHGSSQIDEFIFNYDISNNNRLFFADLDQLGGGGGSNPYVFSYNRQNELPAFGSNQTDLWGYFNGLNNITGTIENYTMEEAVHVEDVKVGVLNRITFATGGAKDFVFESNTFNYDGNELINPRSIPENYHLINRQNSFIGDALNNPPQEIYFYLESGQSIPIDIQTMTMDPGVDQSMHRIFVQKVTVAAGANPDPLINSYSSSDFVEVQNGVSADLSMPNLGGSVRHEVPLSSGWYKIKIVSYGYFPDQGLSHNFQIDVNAHYVLYDFQQVFRYGGGLRIKEITFVEDPSLLQLTERNNTKYFYSEQYPASTINTDLLALSSGTYGGFFSRRRSYTLHKNPTFAVNSQISLPNGDPVPTPYTAVNGINYSITEDNNSLAAQMTKSSYIGYAVVYKTVDVNDGYVKSEFSSFSDHPAYPVHYNYPFVPPIEQDFKRGLLISQEIMNNQEALLSKTNFNYSFVSDDIVKPFHIRELTNDCEYEQFYNTYYGYTNRIADSPFPEGGQAPSNPCCNCGEVASYNGAIPYWYNNGRAYLQEQNTTEYFYDDTGQQEEIQSRKTFSYDLTNFQVSEEHSFFAEQGIEQHDYTKYYYTTSPGIHGSSLTELINLNKLNELLAVEAYINGEKLSTIVNRYGEVAPNLILPERVESAKQSGVLESRIEFLKYGAFENPLEMRTANGIHIIYIWGYNFSLPIAKIENASYDGLTPSQITALVQVINASDADVNEASEENLRTALQQLRLEFPEGMMKGYTYDIGVGVTSSIDARGYTTYAQYDDLHRLTRVLDDEGNLLSENVYNTRNQ